VSIGDFIVDSMSSKLENLQMGRGTKAKLGHRSYSVKLSPQDKKRVESIAESFDCTYGDGGSISGLLSKIASKELMVVTTPPNIQYDSFQDTSSPYTNGEVPSDIEEEILPSPEELLQNKLPELDKKMNDRVGAEQGRVTA
jgi:hypothetical protein